MPVGDFKRILCGSLALPSEGVSFRLPLPTGKTDPLVGSTEVLERGLDVGVVDDDEISDAIWAANDMLEGATAAVFFFLAGRP